MKFQKSAYITVENGENLERIGFCKCKLWPYDKTLPLFGSLRYYNIILLFTMPISLSLKMAIVVNTKCWTHLQCE